jgi:hypothetical protein
MSYVQNLCFTFFRGLNFANRSETIPVFRKYFVHLIYQNETFAMAGERVDQPGVTKILNLEEEEDPSKINFGEIRERLSEDREDLMRSFSSFESYFSYPLSWLTNKCDYLTETFDKFLLEVEQSGFKQYYEDAQFIQLNIWTPDQKPKILTMQMLSAGFIVWLVSVGIACVVFIIEHIVAYATRR